MINKKSAALALVFLLLFLFACGGKRPGESESSGLSAVSHIEDESFPALPENIRAAGVTSLNLEQKAAVTREGWESHFDELKTLGIDYVICAFTALTPYAAYQRTYFPASQGMLQNKDPAFTQYQEALENLLFAANEKGMKVFLGLNYAGEWDMVRASNTDWNTAQAERGAEIAGTIYKMYAEKYPGVLYGWYISWQMNNSYIVYKHRESADLLNKYIRALKKIAPGMPVLFSTVLGNDHTAATTANAFSEMLSLVEFGENDIYCAIDGIGTGQMRMDSSDYYLNLITSAAKKAGLTVWVGCETTVYGQPGQPAPLKRFMKQLETAGKYTGVTAAFSYSDAYSSAFGASPSVGNVYAGYVKSGVMEEEIPPGAPRITCVEIKGRNAVSVKISVTQNTYAVKTLALFIDGVPVAEFENTTRPNPKTVYEESFYLDLETYGKGKDIVIEALATDISGNISEKGNYQYTGKDEVP